MRALRRPKAPLRAEVCLLKAGNRFPNETYDKTEGQASKRESVDSRRDWQRLSTGSDRRTTCVLQIDFAQAGDHRTRLAVSNRQVVDPGDGDDEI